MRSSFEGQRIVVTGANGFIGSHLCRRLCQEGAEVHAVYRSQRPNDLGEQHWWQADLGDEPAVRKLVRETRPQLIFHLASHVKGAPNLEHVLPTFHSNLQSTVNLLVSAAESGSRVVLTGSLAEPDVENGETFPSAPYAAAKWAGSGYARMFHALYKVPVAIARVFMVYGPAQKDLTKLIPYVVLSALQGKTPKISSGQRLVDWIYISDVVDGLLALASAANVDGATLDIGSGSLVSTREIVQLAIMLTGTGINAEFGALADRPLEPIRTAKTAETLARTGWTPKVSLREGLKRTVDWYRAAMKQSPEIYQAVVA
ncbi:MAG TPA: SDR family NAD(P)-dependent oxidoreductase [Candidatus Acidoferrales bacterium]|nr:SDR family NAD(P)-dependent oxidoreductase [Candidatus Acidoferrales bacterium]